MSVMDHVKLCECGCGCPAPIAKLTNRRYGHVQGQPVRFIQHHNTKGSQHHNWNNGRTVTAKGYVNVLCHGHPRADHNGYVLEHLLIAEKALGRFIPIGIEIHHVNERHDDNRGVNLVICQDHAYHLLLHKRARALKESGHAHWLSCPYCGAFSPPDEMYISKNGSSHHHRACVNDYHRSRTSKCQ